jgi:tetratricopeptide (TPR) repeat protein
VRLKEAAKAFETSLTLEPSRSAHANLGTLYYYLGDFRAALRHYESAEAFASEDYRVVGGLADALWQLDGRREDAVRAYERAAALAESSLKVNPSQADVWAQLAFYSGRMGDRQRATRAQARAEALDDDDMYVHYFIALAEADRKDAAAAVAAMERAEKSGYPRALLYADPVLRPLLPKKRA